MSELDEKEQIIKQFKETNKLLKEREYDKALELAKIYGIESVVIPRIAKKMMKEKEYEKLEEMGNKEEVLHNLVFQSQLINIYLTKGDYEKAEKIGNREEFIHNPIIQSQMITIAINQGNYEKAKEIGSRKEFADNPIIQSQMITITINQGNYEKAKEIGNRKEFENDAKIQSQMVTIAMIEEDNEKVYEITSRNELKDDKVIKRQKEKMLAKSRKKQKETTNEDINDEKNKVNKFLDQIYTKIYYGRIEQKDIDEINENKELSDIQKVLSLLAIYEQMKNVKSAKQIVKKYKAEHPDSEHIKTLNQIIKRIENKKIKVLDKLFYEEKINWKLDSKLSKAYEEEQKQESKDFFERIKVQDIQKNQKIEQKADKTGDFDKKLDEDEIGI